MQTSETRPVVSFDSAAILYLKKEIEKERKEANV
jgi:hypothetical protein